MTQFFYTSLHLRKKRKGKKENQNLSLEPVDGLVIYLVNIQTPSKGLSRWFTLSPVHPLPREKSGMKEHDKLIKGKYYFCFFRCLPASRPSSSVRDTSPVGFKLLPILRLRGRCPPPRTRGSLVSVEDVLFVLDLCPYCLPGRRWGRLGPSADTKDRLRVRRGCFGRVRPP